MAARCICMQQRCFLFFPNHLPNQPAFSFLPPQLVDEHWVVKVSDFNLSKILETAQQGSSASMGGANNPIWLVRLSF